MIDLDRYPISQARSAGGMIFVSGQLPITKDGTIIRGDIGEQTRMALSNLAAALKTHGATLDDVLKVTAWLSDSSLSAGYNEAYQEVFRAPYPARSTVVATLLVPADVEIEAVAIIGTEPPSR